MSGEAPSQYCAKCGDPLSMCCCEKPVIVAALKTFAPLAITSSEWVDALARSVCHAVEQRSDDCDMEMHQRVKDTLSRWGVTGADSASTAKLTCSGPSAGAVEHNEEGGR